MYPNMQMPPFWGMPQQPTQDPVTMITGWIRGLEELKKSMREEDKKDPKKKPVAGGPSIISMMFFMLLVSPITGPAMYYFFQMSLQLLPKVQ